MKKSIFDKLKLEESALGSLASFSHGTCTFPVLEGAIGPQMFFNNKPVLNWSINNYLGLANHPEVRKYDASIISDYGLSYPMGSRMMSGNSQAHEQFETALANFTGYESALLLNLGYSGVMSSIETLVNHKDVIVYDAQCHACLIDGIRLHKAKGGIYFKYLHNDIDSLHLNLRRAKAYTHKTGGAILVITEGVYGMSGELGKLDQIVALKQEFDFTLLVDDAHGFGVMGKNGRGTPEHFEVQNGVDLYFATFTKSMSSLGGFIAGPEKVITYLKYNVRSQVFSRTLPMGYVLGGLKRLEIMQNQPELRHKLINIADRLQQGLKNKGFDLGTTNSHVTPVFFRNNCSAREVANLLHDLRNNMGIFCSGVIYPVIPKGQIMLRLIPTALHTESDVDYTIACFEKIRENFFSGSYAAKEIETAEVF